MSKEQDAERYHKVKRLTKEQILLWRGAYGCSDASLDEMKAEVCCEHHVPIVNHCEKCDGDPR